MRSSLGQLSMYFCSTLDITIRFSTADVIIIFLQELIVYLRSINMEREKTAFYYIYSTTLCSILLYVNSGNKCYIHSAFNNTCRPLINKSLCSISPAFVDRTGQEEWDWSRCNCYRKQHRSWHNCCRKQHRLFLTLRQCSYNNIKCWIIVYT